MSKTKQNLQYKIKIKNKNTHMMGDAFRVVNFHSWIYLKMARSFTILIETENNFSRSGQNISGWISITVWYYPTVSLPLKHSWKISIKYWYDSFHNHGRALETKKIKVFTCFYANQVKILTGPPNWIHSAWFTHKQT